MIDRTKIESIANVALSGTNGFIVDVIVSRSNVIQVFVDHENGISLDECAKIHKSIEDQLDREKEDFELQVSSPGLGRPIQVFAQYLKAKGQKLEIVLKDEDIIKGILLEAKPSDKEKDAELVVRQTGTKRKPAPEEPVNIPVSHIKTARVEIDFNKV